MNYQVSSASASELSTPEMGRFLMRLNKLHSLDDLKSLVGLWLSANELFCSREAKLLRLLLSLDEATGRVEVVKSAVVDEVLDEGIDGGTSFDRSFAETELCCRVAWAARAEVVREDVVPVEPVVGIIIRVKPVLLLEVIDRAVLLEEDVDEEEDEDDELVGQAVFSEIRLGIIN